MFWNDIWRALRSRWVEPQSFVVTSDFHRDIRHPDDEVLTEDQIIAEQPEWVPPRGAQTDPDRPRTTLGPW